MGSSWLLVLKFCISRDSFWDSWLFLSEFRWSPCLVKWFLSSSTSSTCALGCSFIILLSFLLNVFTSWFTQELGRRSCLWGEFITTMFISLCSIINSDNSLRALVELFLLMSLAPPHTSVSSPFRFFISSFAILVISLIGAVGFTKLEMLYCSPRLSCSLVARFLT